VKRRAAHERAREAREKFSRAREAIREAAGVVYAAYGELEDTIADVDASLASAERARARPLNVNELVAYSLRISATVFAPRGWDPSTHLGNRGRPPAPQEHTLREGMLFVDIPDPLVALGVADEFEGAGFVCGCAPNANCTSP
jgi:vitamin-D-receptor interacting mediator subunit 4